MWAENVVKKEFPEVNNLRGFPGGSDGKESTSNAGDLGLIPEWGSLGKGMATHSSILAWRIL